MIRCAVVAAVLAGFLGWVLLPYQGSFTPERKAKYSSWAVVAGASEGLGAAWGDELASHGLNLVLMARSAKKLENVAAKIRERHSVKVDTLVMDLMKITTEDVEKKVIGDREVGLFVYNAAYSAGGEFLDISMEEHLKVSQLNINSLMTMTHSVGTFMKGQGRGGIVLMGSMAGTIGTAYFPSYSSSKSFITSFSRALWYELGSKNVDVLGCLAGATTTPGYLRSVEKAGSGRDEMIEQTAEAVVQECLSALGQTGAVATGALNKLSHGLLKHLLPGDYGMRFISYMTNIQTNGGKR